MVVEQVRPEVTYRLRQRVLMPDRSIAQAGLPGDFERSSGHFAAYVDDVVVGIASVVEEPEPAGPGVWRLRGPVVDPADPDGAVGAALLARVRDFVARSGGGPIWGDAADDAPAPHHAGE